MRIITSHQFGEELPKTATLVTQNMARVIPYGKYVVSCLIGCTLRLILPIAGKEQGAVVAILRPVFLLCVCVFVCCHLLCLSTVCKVVISAKSSSVSKLALVLIKLPFRLVFISVISICSCCFHFIGLFGIVSILNS